jgi:hypothetical protein
MGKEFNAVFKDIRVDACLRWYHINARRRIEALMTEAPKPSKKTETVSAAKVASTAEQVKTKIRAAVQTTFLDFVMPNDKPLRDCTFREVGRFGDKFKKLAALGKPNQIVGQVLSEKQASAVLS